jgi:ABC-type methionine transport system ATPase subunit
MLLDDPFSALDIETSRTILERLFGKTGILRQLQSTVLLATSSSMWKIPLNATLSKDTNLDAP